MAGQKRFSHTLSAFWQWFNGDKQFVELFLRNRPRGVGKRADGALRLGKRDHVAQAVRLAQHHHPAIKTKGDAAVGWSMLAGEFYVFVVRRGEMYGQELSPM